MTDIGATLREARMRERIDVSEIEAKTKIRARYLRALENEEWDLLPGPTFVRSFLRTYAQALGLDGKGLVEEYRLRFEPPADVDHQPVVSAPRKRRARASAGPSRGLLSSRGYVLAVGVVGVIVVLLVIGLLVGGKGETAKSGNAPSNASARSGSGSRSHARPGAGTGSAGAGAAHRARAPASGALGAGVASNATSAGAQGQVSLSLRPSGAVYVCLLGDGNRKLIPGVTLSPPYTPVTFHASRFQLTLGNNAVTLYVDGKPVSVPPSSNAIGYSITSAGRHPLALGQMPTCK